MNHDEARPTDIQNEWDENRYVWKSSRSKCKAKRRWLMWKTRAGQVIIREHIVERDGPVCYICNATLTKERITLDHLVPLTRGGTNTLDNIKVCCEPCNTRKGNLLQSELIAFFAVFVIAARHSPATYIALSLVAKKVKSEKRVD